MKMLHTHDIRPTIKGQRNSGSVTLVRMLSARRIHVLQTRPTERLIPLEVDNVDIIVDVQI